MGILNKLFGKDNNSEKKENKVLPWIPLAALDQLADIKERSAGKAQIIFKHSTTCGISRMVMGRFTEAYSLSQDQVDLYYLEIQSNRSISDEIADLFQVRHESPQLLIIKNGVVVVHDSHSGITNLNLEKYV